MNFILDDLDVKIAEFKSHKFELEKEYRHHMSLPIISEYLEFVFKEKGLKSAIQLFDFIITVQVLQNWTWNGWYKNFNFQAKYINMLMLYNLYQNKPDQAFNYLTHFKKQILEFCKTLNNITFIGKVIPEYSRGRLHYKELIKLVFYFLKNRIQTVRQFNLHIWR